MRAHVCEKAILVSEACCRRTRYRGDNEQHNCGISYHHTLARSICLSACFSPRVGQDPLFDFPATSEHDFSFLVDHINRGKALEAPASSDRKIFVINGRPRNLELAIKGVYVLLAFWNHAIRSGILCIG